MRTFNSLYALSIIISSAFVSAWSFGSDRNSCSRRQILAVSPSTAATAGLVLLLQHPSWSKATAASSLDPGEAVRQAASNLPGYGPADVYYPLVFKGSWVMRRQVVLGDSGRTLDLVYPVRFLSSMKDDAVVADRGFNQANLENALLTGSVQSFDWKESNPNDLRVLFRDGGLKDIKVTRRASERTDRTVSSSEFQRVVTQEAMNGVPTITARRVLTKWKVSDDDGSVLQGLEFVYDEGAGGDPLSPSWSAGSQQQQQQSRLLSKSRMTLSRE